MIMLMKDMVECDIHYPEELHDSHNCYPLCPSNKVVEKELLSDYSQHLKKSLNIKNVKVSKLIADLTDKEHYIIHYRYLKLCIELGLKVTKIHRVVKFKQSQWLKPYIDLKQSMHLKKIYSSSVYGKTMENVRGRMNFLSLHQEHIQPHSSINTNIHTHNRNPDAPIHSPKTTTQQTPS
eukprot:Lithocolla_globosa_v1_NODE_351_length_4361_cov_64.948676.p1 type:complete len:179 gc:universal NODE_351_length_4361_cov_64.948676:943-407(-)